MVANRRLRGRTIFKEPHLAALHPLESDSGESLRTIPLFVGVLDHGEGGFQIDSPQPLGSDQIIHFSFYNFISKEWHGHVVRVAWERAKNLGPEHIVGIQIVAECNLPAAYLPAVAETTRRQVLDGYSFLLQTDMFAYVPRHAIWSLLNYLQAKEVCPEECLIRQGDPGDSIFIIQDGSCTVVATNEGESYQLARLGRGEVVGEMAVLTGEPRSASVVAETAMKFWRLGSLEFETISERHSELRLFLTQLLNVRLESGKQTAKRTIGKYVIRTKLGNGAWGIVYEGVHAFLNMAVAIKMLKHPLAMDEEFHGRFLQEAKIIAMFNHRNIVHVYDVEALYRTLFIVMELLDGQTMAELLTRHGALPAAKAVIYLMQICSGLAYAHEKGIIHQDIKPANIQILPDDQIKIMDFGLACPVGSENFDMEGTTFYMSPEQIDSQPVDFRTDIYNLGITAYEMVTGRRPYPEDNLTALIDLHLNEDIPDPALSVPDLPEELRRFITKSCARLPEDRYQDMNEAIAELTPYYNSVIGNMKPLRREKQRMTSLFFLYQDEQIGPVSRLIEEMQVKAEKLGVVLRAAEFKDI